MDDTLADESGIPVIANSDDIPVHSTPIKGTKIPLPSTRHVMKAVFENGKPYSLSEQEISELPNIPEEKSINRLKPVGQGHDLKYGASVEDDRKQIAGGRAETERENIDKIVKSTEEKVLFSSHKGSFDNLRNYSDENERQHHPQYHPRSASDSNRRFDPSPHDYRRDDNLRTHFHSKQPRSHSTGASHDNDMRSDFAQNNDKKSDITHERDRRSDTAQIKSHTDHNSERRTDILSEDFRRPYSPNRFDKFSNRTNKELDKMSPSNRNENSLKYVQKRDGQYHFKDSFHDLSPRTYRLNENDKQRNESTLTSNTDKSKTDKTNTSEIRSDTKTQTSKTHSTRNDNTNAFSSYAFQSKESGKPRRHLYGDLDLSPTYNKHERLKDRTTDISPLARRRPVSDTRCEQSGAGLRSLSMSVKQASYSEMEVSTIQKQRQEIQLLMTELKDRDRELGDMMSSHQQQLLAWEQDRQRVVSLDRKCTQYEADIQAKSTQLHNVHKALKAVKSKQATLTEEAEINKLTVERLLRENDQLKQQLAQYQDKCDLLQKTVQELSNTVGRLQAREEELNTSIKLKEKDIISATNQMKDLSDRLRQLDNRCKDSQDREKIAVREKEEWRMKYEQSKSELQPLKDAVEDKSKQISQLEEEILSLRHHLSVLQKDAGMREKCQEELIESMRVKQERTDSQLKNFRELYERQLKELSKLQLQLDTSKDIITKQQSSLDEQQLSGSYSIRGNSRLSDRSPDRQRNTVSQTSRYREPDLDSHISQQQSSGYQTQVSGNQSELLETQSTATGAQLQAQSYRISHGEGSVIGNKTDNDYAKFSQDKLRPKDKIYSSDNAFIQQEIPPKHVRLKGAEQKPPSGKETSLKRSVPNIHGAINRSPPGSPKTAHSEPLSVLPQANLPPCDTMQISPPRRGGYVIDSKLTKTKSSSSLPVLSQDKQESGNNNPKSDSQHFLHNEAQNRQETYSNRQNSDQAALLGHQAAFEGQSHQATLQSREATSHGREATSHGREATLQVCEATTQNHQATLQGQNSDCQVALQDREATSHAQDRVTGAENQYSDPYMFENRLTSFLEDIDDIDDAIWDEQGNISKVLPQGEGSNSPGSKLLNLLLESRKMIQSLEETANPPTSRQGPKSEGQGDQK